MSTCTAAAPSSQLASSSRSSSALPGRKPRIRGPIDPGHTPLQNAASKTTLTIIPSPRPLSGVFRPLPDYTSLGWTRAGAGVRVARSVERGAGLG